MLPNLTLALTTCLDPPQSINKLPCISQGWSWGKQAAQPWPPRKRQGSPSTGQSYRRTQSDSCLGLCRRSPTGRPDVAPLPCMRFNSGSLVSPEEYKDRGSRRSWGLDQEGWWGERRGGPGGRNPLKRQVQDLQGQVLALREEAEWGSGPLGAAAHLW